MLIWLINMFFFSSNITKRNSVKFVNNYLNLIGFQWHTKNFVSKCQTISFFN